MGGGNFGLLGDECWKFVMGYCMVICGNLLVILWRMEVVCYGLLCGEFW